MIGLLLREALDRLHVRLNMYLVISNMSPQNFKLNLAVVYNEPKIGLCLPPTVCIHCSPNVYPHVDIKSHSTPTCLLSTNIREYMI